ncbi:uncharacterized protein TNCV_2531751 [Trichonephila clavipes]|nr:uncharacterized protein TNCV_2531751 [Trichonephila clavipes]
MFGSRSLQLDKRRQASRRIFEAGILTSRKVFSEESEWKSESSYWLLKSEDNGSGKMAAHFGGGIVGEGLVQLSPLHSKQAAGQFNPIFLHPQDAAYPVLHMRKK